jgi:hypothetical protein
MKRSDLYQKVWSTPITRLAAELGLSDVGLAKACRRHAVPVPPRGYWAKLKAGQRPSKISLPAPELDVVVELATRDPEEVARQKVAEESRRAALQVQASSVQGLPPITFAKDLEEAHPLVKATQRYCDRLPGLIEKWKRRRSGTWGSDSPDDWLPGEQHGRYSLVRKGCLDITASLESMDWILRFHATVLGGLTAGGMTIVRREGKVDPRADQSAVAPGVEMHFNGEVLAIKFSEGYRRVRLSPQEFAARKKEMSWANEYEMRPSGNFTFNISGKEAHKEWKGTGEKLQGQVDEIVRTAFQLASQQPQLRQERKVRELEAQKAAELEERERRQREARTEQLKQAFLMMDADERVRKLQAFLDRLEKQEPGLHEPFNERAAVWVRVVREELSRRNPADEILERCLTVQSWMTWPPAWWPEEPDRGSEEAGGGSA